MVPIWLESMCYIPDYRARFVIQMRGSILEPWCQRGDSRKSSAPLHNLTWGLVLYKDAYLGVMVILLISMDWIMVLIRFEVSEQ